MLKYLIASGMTIVREGHRDFYSWSSTMLNDFGPSIEPLLRDLFNWSLFMAGNRHNPIRRGINCWEFKQCRHERDTPKERRRVCPAVVETRLNGVHGGANAGRSCWVVDGTLDAFIRNRRCASRVISISRSLRKKVSILSSPLNFSETASLITEPAISVLLSAISICPLLLPVMEYS